MASLKKTKEACKKNYNIFISWSGDSSKKIAEELKKCLESIFVNVNLTCFVSDLNITSGTDWWNAIRKQLLSCKLGIVCITKDNILAPWIYFEAGALVARNVNTIPLLVNANFRALNTTPLNQKQAVDFNDSKKFIKMLQDIKRILNIDSITEDQLSIIGREKYEEMKDNLTETISELKKVGRFSEKYVYPGSVTTIKKNTIFVSAPMSSIGEDDYSKLREVLPKITKALKEIGFDSVICPINAIESQTEFDGKTKAIRKNFPAMKKCDSLLIIYPRRLPSSVLVELGYGIALSKNTLICYGEDLPYMLQEAGEEIHFIKTHHYSDLIEIEKYIRDNGMSLFKEEQDE